MMQDILLTAEPNAEEIAAAKSGKKKIKEDIKSGKMTFKEFFINIPDDKIPNLMLVLLQLKMVRID